MQEISFGSEEEYSKFFDERQKLSILCIDSNTCTFCKKEHKALDQLEVFYNRVFTNPEDKKIDIFTMNIDNAETNTEIADNLNVDVLPSLIFINAGKIIEINDPDYKSAPYTLQGYYSSGQLKKIINYLVNNPEITEIGKIFFGESCNSCKKLSNHGRNYCKKHHIKVNSEDSCIKYGRNAKYRIR